MLKSRPDPIHHGVSYNTAAAELRPRELGGNLRANIHDVRLVDYADVLAAPAPTWVAGALATFITCS